MKFALKSFLVSSSSVEHNITKNDKYKNKVASRHAPVQISVLELEPVRTDRKRKRLEFHYKIINFSLKSFKGLQLSAEAPIMISNQTAHRKFFPAHCVESVYIIGK